MTKETGGPAFPRDKYISQEGMTLRDYFAAKALQGMCSVTGVDFGTNLEAAKLVYAMADAMLKARKLSD